MNQDDKEIRDVLEQLSVLEPTAVDAPRLPSHALAQIKRRLDEHEQAAPSRPSFWQRLFASPPQRAWGAALAFLLITAFAFSFPSVRAAAGDFLGLFRVQKFAAISVSPEQLALLRELEGSGLTPGQLEVLEEPGELTPVGSLAEATAVTGILPRTLPNLGEPEQIYIMEGGSGRLTIDVAGARAILEATGVDPQLLPESVDGEPVNIEIFTGIEQDWADGSWLLQTESPEVSYPAGLDPTTIGSALLQVLGMEEAEAARLATSIDWTSTLLLPIPQDFARYSEVMVNGVSGLGLTSLDGQKSAVLWQTNGTVYLLLGPRPLAEQVTLAEQVE